jgi:HD-like signal output (HDOD) protein
MVNKVSMEQEWIRTVLWWHSLNTGLLATFLNRSFQLGFHGEEFTAGIIHDIGRTLIAVVCPEQVTEIDPLTFDESPEMLEREFEVLGTDHSRLGAWFAQQNRIPDPIPEVILRHHEPERAKEHQKLTTLVAVADHMANYIQRHGDAEGYDPQSNPFLGLLSTFTKPPFESHFMETAVTLMQEAQRDAKLMLDL